MKIPCSKGFPHDLMVFGSFKFITFTVITLHGLVMRSCLFNIAPSLRAPIFPTLKKLNSLCFKRYVIFINLVERFCT